MKYHGFYFKLGRKDVFVITQRKNKTLSLYKEICKKLLIPDSQSVLSDLAYYLQSAELEIKQLSNGRKYNEISGKNFGGCGHFVDEDLDIIIHL